jgi:hypothetical protein
MPIRDEDGHRAMQAAGKAWKAIKTSGAKTWREWTGIAPAKVELGGAALLALSR